MPGNAGPNRSPRNRSRESRHNGVAWRIENCECGLLPTRTIVARVSRCHPPRRSTSRAPTREKFVRRPAKCRTPECSTKTGLRNPGLFLPTLHEESCAEFQFPSLSGTRPRLARDAARSEFRQEDIRPNRSPRRPNLARPLEFPASTLRRMAYRLAAENHPPRWRGTLFAWQQSPPPAQPDRLQSPIHQ